MNKIDPEHWFHFLPKRPDAKIRLFCFPYGGGSSNVFRGWDKALSKEIEVIAIKLPGRGNRINEKSFQDWGSLIGALEKAFIPYLDKPFVFFGHSLGACIAFDLVKRFQEKNGDLPRYLFVAGCQCPHIPAFQSPVHNLPRAEFFNCISKMNGTPAELLENENFMAVIEPALRADILLAELWKGSPEEKINVPIIACAGLSDEVAPPGDMEPWANYTNSEFSFYLFQGNHFFLHNKQRALLNLISSIIQEPAQTPLDLNTSAYYPENKTIALLFEEQAEKNPENIALIYKDQQMSYRELNRRANQMAHYLIKAGVKEEVLVGVCIERSFDLIIALLAILKAGGAYLPLDKNYPRDRLEFMLTDSKALILICENSILSDLSVGDIPQIILERDQLVIEKESEINPRTNANIDNLVYVNYTSGSTGKPKGVETLHRGVIRLLFGANYARLDSSRIFLQHSPISFDAATFEIWGPLLHGARCVIFSEKWLSSAKLHTTIEKNSITTLFLTTALFNTIIDSSPEILLKVEQLLTGGEAHSVLHVQKALAHLPNTEIISVYGPTETTTFATFYPIHYINQNSLSIPIGFPISNTQAFVLDENLAFSATGVPGELYIGGAGLARGYLYQAELTREKFIENLPLIKQRVYKTGDRVRYLSNGSLDFLGRVDYQVKIHGFRIELGEIEATLRLHPSVSQVIVEVDEKAYNDKKILAHLVCNNAKPDKNELMSYLQTRLPKYMIPEQFYCIDVLPLTPTGKIDRKALLRVNPL